MTRAWVVSGGGNDFLALVEPLRDPSATEIAAWCARGISIGADGVFTLRQSTPGSARMSYWNADGQLAPLCLNGTRCAARLALRLGWGTDSVVIETGAGPCVGRTDGATSIAVNYPSAIATPTRRVVELDGQAIEGWYLVVGVPHFVTLWESSLSACPVERLGAPLRHHPAFELGTNVNFVRFPGRDQLEIRTYERGVDAETLACGTGVLAAAAVGIELGRVALPLIALTRGGFVFKVSDGAAGTWSLAGDARLLGEIELGDEASLPPPVAPAWSS